MHVRALWDPMWPKLYRNKGVRRAQRSLCCEAEFAADSETDEGASEALTEETDNEPVPRLQVLLLLF